MTLRQSLPSQAGSAPSLNAAPRRQLLGYQYGLLGGDLFVSVAMVAGLLGMFGLLDADLTFRATQVITVSYAVVWLTLPALLQVAIALRGGYRSRTLGVGSAEYRDVVTGTGLSAALMAIGAYLADANLSRGFFIAVFPLLMVTLLVWRYCARQLIHALRRRGHLLQPVMVVGDRFHASELIGVLRRESWTGYRVVGACLPRADAGEKPETVNLQGVPILGEPAEIRAALAECGATTVFLTSGGGVTSRDFRRVTWQLEGTGAQIAVVPSLTDVAGPRISVRPVAGLPLLHVDLPAFTGPQRFVKRSLDVVIAAALIAVLALPAVILGALIRAESRGPVFFRQVRVGRDAREFWCWKLRTMRHDAEETLADLLASSDGNGLLFKMREDPRVTRVGRVLRRLSLDELPQLINVLRGEMSLVGPRPPLPVEVAQYDDDLRRRLMVRPGMTGLWQISGRSELSVEESTRLDLYYIDNWSVIADLEILWKTVRAVLSGHGAY